jgi:hypothetical protein
MVGPVFATTSTGTTSLPVSFSAGESGSAKTTTRFSGPQMCRLWWEAEQCPWACAWEPTPDVLQSAEVCATCPHWEPRLITTKEVVWLDA